MKVLWLGPGPRPATPLTVQALVAEGLYSSGAGMRTQATSSISMSNVRLTETSVLADVTIVPTPSRTSYPVSVQLRDGEQLVVTKSMPIEVYNTCQLSVTPAALPAGTVNSPYAPVSLGAIGGTAPYQFEVSAGSLPPGITLVNGSLSGLPTAAGTYDFTITGASADRCLARQSYTLVVGGPSCAIDASNQVSVMLGGFRRNLVTGRWQQTVTLTHTGATAINGPVRVALQSLSANATLFNAAGTTQCAAPQGRPYVTVNLGSEPSLRPGQTVSVALDFVNTTPAQAITYTPRVLAGGISQ
jgi:hypothetical protein